MRSSLFPYRILPALLMGLFAMHFASAQETYVVDSIRLEGIKKTKPAAILRELPFQSGDKVSAEKLEAVKELARNNVYNTRLFTRVEISHELEGQNIHFTFTVQERWYIWPLAYVTFEERSFNEWWEDKDLDRMVYGAGLVWENFTGQGDIFSAYVQLGYSRRVTLGFERPALFARRRIDASIGYKYIDYKEIGYGTEGGFLQLARLRNRSMQKSHFGFVEMVKRFDTRRRLSWSVWFNHFQPSDSILEFNERYLTTGARPEFYPSFVISYKSDQRDWQSYPLDGYKYFFTIRKSGLPGLGTANFLRLRAGFSQYIPLSKRWNIAYGLYNDILIGKRVPFFDKFAFGYDVRLRGYERYVVDGNWLSMLKTELKFAVIPRQMLHLKFIPLKKFQDLPIGLYLTAFGDVGYAMDNTFSNFDQTLKDRLLVGRGFGLHFLTVYDFLFKFEYGWNHLGQHGLQFGTKITIR